MNNYLLALIVILTMILIMEAVRFLRLRKCCGKDRCKCGERKDAFYREKRLFLKQLGESGLLAQEIAEKEKHVGLQKVQINTLLQEFHSLVFFGYLKPDYEAGFKKELEKHYETFVQKADKGGKGKNHRPLLYDGRTGRKPGGSKSVLDGEAVWFSGAAENQKRTLSGHVLRKSVRLCPAVENQKKYKIKVRERRLDDVLKTVLHHN